MLTRFHLANFKSYRDATLELGPLTLMVGANASGKSNALEALQMLSWLALGRRLDDIFNPFEDFSFRGTLDNLTLNGAEGFCLGSSLVIDGMPAELEVELFADSSGLRIRQESLSEPTESVPFYRVEKAGTGDSHDLLVAYNNFARGGKKPQITCTDQQAVFTQLLTPARFGADHKRSQREIPALSKAFATALESVLFLDPAPWNMRSYSFIVDKVMKGSGGNLSATLYDLCEVHGQKQHVLDFIRDLPEQNITDIDFLEGPRKEVMVRLQESFGGNKAFREAAVLSDGTLRVLAVAAAVLSAPEGSTVVVEEIDNGVHPSRARQLLAKIDAVARSRHLVVLLTSHNPALLDALPTAAVPDVVFCYRDPVEGDSRLTRLRDLPDYPELVAQGPLGRLVTQGVLDRFVKSSRSTEQRVARGLAWVDALEAHEDTP